MAKMKLMPVQVETNGATFVVMHHDCREVGDVELSDDWRFCPWCGFKIPNWRKSDG